MREKMSRSPAKSVAPELLNEFGEPISEEILDALTSRIRQLPDSLLDDLWESCGFVIPEPGEHKALPQRFIRRLRESDEAAKGVVSMLLLESPLEEVSSNLARIELEVFGHVRPKSKTK